ncbi:hypothetical protein KGM_215137 [Danaus plexippus plexippus]|uniref:EF-hand domain-containing protein n=1 Tax=Danaus plexippus plexippus TaxID=278856 RepID=A0A212EYP6_DANPL|nr:hypothetical protein KGM_215137 [Danaus plexippus plexippus]
MGISRIATHVITGIDENHEVYTDDQIEAVLDEALNYTDLNKDGYVDYHEYRINLEKGKLKRSGRKN